MAAAAAVAQSLRPAEVVFTHHKPVEAWREGDRCWISPNALIGWGLPYTFTGNDATIQCEGRTLRLSGRTSDGKFLLPLDEIAAQLGAELSWDPKKDSVSLLGTARFITVRNGKVTVESTLSTQPEVTTMDSPSRIVVDLKGLKMGNGCKLDLDASARAAQYTPDTVRIMIVTNERPTLGEFKPTRSFNLLYSLNPVTPTENIKPPEIIPQPPKTNLTTPAPKVWTTAGPFVLVKENDRAVQLSLGLTAPLSAAPNFKRIDPLTLELTLPYAHYEAPPQPIGSPSLTAFEPVENETGTVLTIRLARPLGVEFSTTAKAVTINMVKPEVGNGRLAGKTVVIDAGHGAHDSGAKSNDKATFEKDLTLSIAKQTAEEMAKEGATVIMTRKTDVFIELKERAEIANRNNADFFVSIHINSNKTAKTSGSISFYHGTNSISQVLAVCMQEELKKLPGIPGIGVWSDYKIYKNDGFSVLRNSKMPAVLLEMGFINNANDIAALKSPNYQSAAAKAIVKGLKVYLGDAKP